jgi:hypothetical protein
MATTECSMFGCHTPSTHRVQVPTVVDGTDCTVLYLLCDTHHNA